MPQVLLAGHRYDYPVSEVLRLFFGPGVKTEGDQVSIGDEKIPITSRLTEIDLATVRVETRCSSDGFEFNQALKVAPDQARREVKRQLYQCLSHLTGIRFPWGSLTGIRPTQIAYEARRFHGDKIDLARRELIETWFVSPGKADLALETAQNEHRLLESIPAESAMVYIGIPFCPSRCAYCSFIARDALSHKALLAPYVNALLYEAKSLFSALEKPTKLSAVYVGGGTPTSLPDELFERLLTGLTEILPLGDTTELTVEAGRPDTISRKKLEAIRQFGANRICINPQTFNDQTLEAIGRRHTTAQTVEAFELARGMGFDHINMDLIAGLPGELPRDFGKSLQAAVKLDPESITLHTLAIKRSSTLADLRRPGSRYLPDPSLEMMLTEAKASLEQNGYAPYYLYRQKDVAGGLENTGFAKPGEGCVYNVGMMGDATPVIGLGSGAMSKMVFGSRVERAPNSRDIKDYIERVDEMIARKLKLFEL